MENLCLFKMPALKKKILFIISLTCNGVLSKEPKVVLMWSIFPKLYSFLIFSQLHTQKMFWSPIGSIRSQAADSVSVRA